MKQKLYSQTMFIGKSLLWSLLLYITAMAIINWDDMSKKNNLPLVSNSKATHTQPASISHGSAIHSFLKPAIGLGERLMQTMTVLY